VLRQYRHRTVEGSNPCCGKGLISWPNRPKHIWVPSCLPFDGCKGSVLGSNRLGREAKHSPPSCADVQNDWHHTSAVYTYLRGVDSVNFLFHYFSNFVTLPRRFSGQLHAYYKPCQSHYY
jgi:hypothetical protein